VLCQRHASLWFPGAKALTILYQDDSRLWYTSKPSSFARGDPVDVAVLVQVTFDADAVEYTCITAQPFHGRCARPHQMAPAWPKTTSA